MYKITGKTHAGGATCGHRVKAGERYYIIRKHGELFAKCRKCVESRKRFRFKKIINVSVNNVINIGCTI